MSNKTIPAQGAIMTSGQNEVGEQTRGTALEEFLQRYDRATIESAKNNTTPIGILRQHDRKLYECLYDADMIFQNLERWSGRSWVDEAAGHWDESQTYRIDPNWTPYPDSEETPGGWPMSHQKHSGQDNERLSGAEEWLEVEAKDHEPDWDNVRWRKLEVGETIHEGDWYFQGRERRWRLIEHPGCTVSISSCECRRLIPETRPGEYEVCEVEYEDGIGIVMLPEWHPYSEYLDTATDESILVDETCSHRWPLKSIPRDDGIFGGMQFEGQKDSDQWSIGPRFITRNGRMAQHDNHQHEEHRPAKCVRVRFLRPE